MSNNKLFTLLFKKFYQILTNLLLQKIIKIHFVHIN